MRTSFRADPTVIPGFSGLRASSAAPWRPSLLPVHPSACPSGSSSSSCGSAVVRAVSTPDDGFRIVDFDCADACAADKPGVEAQQKRSKVEIIKEQSNFIRDERGAKSYSFMLRTKNPFGDVPNRLYLVMDDLADQFGTGTLRLTTRQTFQLHAAPYVKKDYLFAQQTAENVASLLTPQARNDNSHGTNFPDSPEPIYGTQFLPRKFKVAVTVPTDNSVDLFTNDIGLVVISDDNGEPQGFNIYVGGGMGRTHRLESTFARLSEPLGYVPKEDILYAVKAIVVTQRENGRRDDRKYSRMKYLISSWGSKSSGTSLSNTMARNLSLSGNYPSGSLRAIWDGSSRVMGVGSNLILCNIKNSWRRPITQALAQGGFLEPKYVDSLNVTAMACPALPLCPLAITEAERGIPDILKRVRAVFERLVGLKYNESVVIRVTGCPNGCARPYMAELGLVGGTPNQTSLARTFMEKVKIQDLEKVFEPLFYHWKRKRLSKESFGEFTTRMGFENLRELVDKWDGVVKSPSRYNLRLFADKATYEAMEELGKLQDKSAHQLAIEVVRNFVAAQQNGKGE
ncbi:hypothetical protein MLD38_017162 [Melastoma candidum]|uniref:Uncharacterized protein n=1 Tax=Melastoma candidum TaxID=119954 RepID=A0ACB9QPN1_9MYRT|nr:hypothetical protein MLD38_017162 [Melastoma candidum]